MGSGGKSTSANARMRPMSSNSSADERRNKANDIPRPRTSGSVHGSRESLNSRPPSRPPSRGSQRGRTADNGRSNTELGPIEAFKKTAKESRRPATQPEGWAITQLNPNEFDENDDEEELENLIDAKNERRKQKLETMPSPNRKLAKSEQKRSDSMKVWLEGPEHDSDEYDTDLEDDFPPEPEPEMDSAGKYIYEKQCLKQGIIPVSYLLRNMGEGNLRMRHHYLGGAGTRPLAQALRDNTVTEEIDLSDNYIEGDGAKCLAQVLKENMFIVNLNISNNFIRTKGAEAFSEMLENNTTLKTLTLKGNQLSDTDAQKIGEAMRNNLSLNTLDLSYNNFGEDGGLHLAAGLASNIALADLDLSWNCITRKGGVAIAKALSKNQSLEILDLSWNGLSNSGCAAFGNILKINKTLKVLDISNNRIGQDGARVLSQGIAKNQGLETLLMGMNPIGEKGVEFMLKGITVNKSLKLVGLEGTVDISITPALQDRIKEITSNRDILIMSSTGAPQTNRISETILTVFERFINENADRMEDLFNQMDKDKSGDITLEEFKYGLKDFGLRLTSKQLDSLLEELDADKSGTIELEELLEGRAIVEQERMKQAKRAKEEQILKDSVINTELSSASPTKMNSNEDT